MECIVWPKNDKKKDFVRTPSLSALSKLLKTARESTSCKNSSSISFSERMQDRTASELLGHKVICHENCYFSFGKINKVDHAKKRCLSLTEAGKYSVAKTKQ